MDDCVVFYGRRWQYPSEHEDERRETLRHPLQKEARSVRLKSHYGRLTDGAYRFLIVGEIVADLGQHGTGYLAEMSRVELAELMDRTEEKFSRTSMGAEGLSLIVQ